MDWKLLLTGISALVSLTSLWIAISAKREAGAAKALELVHQKRMLLGNHLAEVSYLVRILRGIDLGSPQLTQAYDNVKEFRGLIIDRLNSASELRTKTKHIKRDQVLNEISDLNTRMAVKKPDIYLLEKYLEMKERN